MSVKIDVRGVEQALRRLRGARTELIDGLDGETEKAALRAANEAAELAPRRDGHLKNSITASPKRLKLMTWEIGSDRPYARRQEYEHATRKGFFRKSLASEKIRYEGGIKAVLKRVGKR